MATLAEIRAKLKEQEGRANGENKSFGDNSTYPFWNLKEGSESTVRFLPDGDPNNTFFWVERAVIKLPFAGIKGSTDSKQVIVQVPCMEMYGESCPVLNEVRTWFKDPALEDMGRKYWKKRSYLFQGFVVDDGLKEENKPENPIRRFIIGPQIFQLIKSAIVDPELEEMPTDYTNGIDFKLIKSTKGGYADYSTSKWSRRTRPLDPSERSAIDQHGLYNLKDYLPKKPGEVELKVIKEMFEASVDGEAFDMDKWGQYFKPVGHGSATGDPNAAEVLAAPVTPRTTVQKPAVTDDDLPWEADPVPTKPVAQESKPASTGGRADDILAIIRNRKAQAQ